MQFVDLSADCSDSDDDINTEDEREQVESSPYWKARHMRDVSPARARSPQPYPPEDNKQLVDDQAPAGVVVEDGKFRLSNVRVFLTYAQCGELTTARVAEKLKERGATSYVISMEKHADGSPHIHAFAERHPAFETSNCRFFDVDGIHPNIRKPKSREECIFYVCKSGTYDSTPGFRIFTSPKNFSRNLADFHAWVDYGRSLASPDPKWPLPLPGNRTLPAPTPHNKRRHLLIVGPPSCGKTTSFAHKHFGGKRIYPVSIGKNRFDSFNGERLILYDDPEPFPSKGELVVLSEAAPYTRKLDARYNNRSLPPGWCAQIVILCNPESIPIDDGVKRTEQAWFTERFVVMEVDTNTVWP